MIEKVKNRLLSFGYNIIGSDYDVIRFALEKVEAIIKNDCNISEIPHGLEKIAIDMAVGEFLRMKKTFAPCDLDCLDLTSSAVKQIQLGDTNTVFATGEGSLTDEQRLDNLINHLLTNGREQFSCFRRIRW
ncbi:MAG: hypothetical protein NC110_07570 [Ruminococcus sp.]|nr:hypothetical protein [Ruminococcus sp.]